jgi:16S rRNA processing protein RimM
MGDGKPDWDQLAVVGRVARPHGLRGHMIVNVATDFAQERFKLGAELFLQGTSGPESRTITAVRFQQDRPVISLGGIDDVEAAKALAGAELRVPVETLTPLPADVFYHHDLIGCEVETLTGDRIGEVSGVEGSAGGSRLVLQTPRGEVMIPLAHGICREIDTAAKRIVIDPPEGLLDLNRRA